MSLITVAGNTYTNAQNVKKSEVTTDLWQYQTFHLNERTVAAVQHAVDNLADGDIFYCLGSTYQMDATVNLASSSFNDLNISGVKQLTSGGGGASGNAVIVSEGDTTPDNTFAVDADNNMMVLTGGEYRYVKGMVLDRVFEEDAANDTLAASVSVDRHDITYTPKSQYSTLRIQADVSWFVSTTSGSSNAPILRAGIEVDGVPIRLRDTEIENLESGETEKSYTAATLFAEVPSTGVAMEIKLTAENTSGSDGDAIHSAILVEEVSG